MTRLSVILICLAICSVAAPQVNQVSADNPSFRTFLARWEESVNHLINGDPTLWKENLSHNNDVTMFGVFGGHEKGWNEVGPRADWAASQFKSSGAKLKIEYLDSGVSGDLAFTVAIERAEVRVGDQNRPWALRATQIFRKEDGAWKLLHRHSDPLVDKKAPSTAKL